LFISLFLFLNKWVAKVGIFWQKWQLSLVAQPSLPLAVGRGPFAERC